MTVMADDHLTESWREIVLSLCSYSSGYPVMFAVMWLCKGLRWREYAFMLVDALHIDGEGVWAAGSRRTRSGTESVLLAAGTVLGT